jgi:Lon protease-like protein
MVEVALFPIPDSVNFPGVPCPLHVFEPRYRKMAQHLLEMADAVQRLSTV